MLSSVFSKTIAKRFVTRSLSVHQSLTVPDFVSSVALPDWIQSDLRTLDELKGQFQATRKKYDDKSFEGYFRQHLGYSSNKLEGNTLTESEVAKVLRGLTIANKPMQDLLDVYYHDAAMQSMLTKVATKEMSFTVDLLKDTHAMCFPEIMKVNFKSTLPGKFKTHANAVIATDPWTGVVYEQRYISPNQVNEEIKKLMVWVAENEHNMELVSFLTLFQYNFVRIHPFADGNGRVARLLTGLLCMRSGLPPMVIKETIREQYIAALTCAHKYLDFEPLLEVMSMSLIETIQDYLEAHPVEDM